MSQPTVITIKDGNYLYSIPSPTTLVSSIQTPYGVNVRTFDMSTKNLTNQESRMFFIEHPDIFRNFLGKVGNNIPANFNMYIQNILTDIKTKNLDVDDYWLNMKAGRRKRRTLRKITRRKRTISRKRTMRRK